MNTPTVNVNLGSGEPILIPLPLDKWRSVTFHVRLGECDYPRDACRFGHLAGCAAFPVKVSCSISSHDGSLEKSEVTDAWPDRNEGYLCSTDKTFPALESACRVRWALVKALMLGHSDLSQWLTGPKAVELLAQRDAVFAALADMARAERAAHAAFTALPMDLRKSSIVAKACGGVAADPEYALLPSAMIFAHYVERLIEQVGVMGT